MSRRFALDNVDMWRGPGAEFYGYEVISGGRTIVFAGGMPLDVDGVLVGAVGVSGGSSEEDQRAVEAGVSAFSG